MSAAASPVELDVVLPRLGRLGPDPSPTLVASVMADAGMVVTDDALIAMMARLTGLARGAGRLDPLLALPGVTDVLVNGPAEVWIDRGEGLERTEVTFADDREVRALAARLAARVGRRLDDASPFVDARLPDGTRVHAVLGSVGDVGTCLSLRVPGRSTLSLDDWVVRGGVSTEGAQLLRTMIAAKVSFLVCGGTGSGKTTLLGALLGEVPPEERLVVVEDSRELAPRHPHCLRLEARPANAEGAGAISLTDLVRQSLRMRPDRVVVGEVRGAEICDLLMALNTGHEGGCGTIHANGPAEVPARLEALAALGGMDRAALQSQAVAALQAVLHVTRSGGVRRVASVSVVRGGADGLECVPAVEFTATGPVLGAGRQLLEGWLSR